MTIKLFFQALTKFVLGLLLIGLLLFLPAGTFDFWQAWLFIAVLFVPMFIAGIIALRIRNEEQVLERELKGYTEYKQRVRYKVIPFIW